MKPERWQQIDKLLQEAMERPAEMRASFLDAACAGDLALRQEVDSLLRHHEQAGSLLETPAYATTLAFSSEEKPKAGQFISHYKILHPLGAGGMGEVYLAEDMRLDRKVAIKLMPAAVVADPQARKRFIREARAAAKLDHPNICAIYEVNEEDGKIFIVMQYVEGETLASRIHRQPLELGAALDLAVQIAEALAEAHAKGIIHRDIKPQNIIINSCRQVKVLDFGLAKILTQESLIDSEAETTSMVSAPGQVMGTVPYMSPEQLRGEAVDARTDIFSFGAVLYELISGKPPFASPTRAEIISAILTSNPPPLTNYGAQVPDALRQIVNKCLEKERHRRYQTLRDVADDLRRLQKQHEPVNSSADTLPALTESQPNATDNRRRTIILAALSFLLLAAIAFVVYYLATRTPTARIDSIVVLPLVNADNNPEMEILCDGMTENLINRFAQLSGLRVMSRSAAFRYKGKDVDPAEVGRSLNVKAVLTGRAVESGDNLIISLNLVNPDTDTQLWGQRYERKKTDLLTLQRELAVDVSEHLRLRLTSADEQVLTKRYTDNDEAYKLYLKGRFYWDKRTPEAISTAIDAYKQAIARDPNYALAYAGLADCYVFHSNVDLPRNFAMQEAKRYAVEALERDDTLAEAHTTLAFIKSNFDYDQHGAEAGFLRAIELNPSYAVAHQFYGNFLILTGRGEAGLAESRRAVELEPYSLAINWSLGKDLYNLHRYDEAIAQLQKTLQLEPDYRLARTSLVRAYLQAKQYEKARELLQKLASDSDPDSQSQVRSQTAYLYAVTDRPTEARKILDELRKTYKPLEGNTVYFIAGIYAALDETEDALQWLERGYEYRTFNMFFLRVDPQWDSLRLNNRFQELMKKIGLTP